MRHDAEPIIGTLVKKKMRNYKYKIRHETEYLLRMRNYIVTNYRSAEELGPFLLKIPPSDFARNADTETFADYNPASSLHLEP